MARAAAGRRDPPRRRALHLAGDSTLATKERRTPNPEYGWGEMLPRHFGAQLTVVHHATNGRAAKSFIDEGRGQKLIDALQPATG